MLIDEVGTEPGPELQQLYQQVLSTAPALAAPEPALPARDIGSSVIPRQPPPGVPHFAGRTQELATLAGLLDRPGQDAPGTAVISAIGGTAGVGKTALAMRWAHQVAGRFPNGQLYVNLRGYDPDQPMPASDALAGFLRALGASGQDIPADADERAALYRSMMAGRRILVVLDNAGSADQVRPLLPGTPGCAAVVTSREAHALADLGDVVRRQSSYQQAIGYHRQALGIFREIGDRSGEAEALLAMGLPDKARIQHAAALNLTIHIGDQQQQAYAHEGLARCWDAVDDSADACHHWQEALARYASLGVPEADRIRAKLAANRVSG